jgi:hypothetical protein
MRKLLRIMVPLLAVIPFLLLAWIVKSALVPWPGTVRVQFVSEEGPNGEHVLEGAFIPLTLEEFEKYQEITSGALTVATHAKLVELLNAKKRGGVRWTFVPQRQWVRVTKGPNLFWGGGDTIMGAKCVSVETECVVSIPSSQLTVTWPLPE